MGDFWVVRPPDRPPVGLAYPADPSFPAFDLNRATIRRQRFGPSWERQRLEVREGAMGDLQPSVDRLLLCSARLKAELDAAKSAEDVLEWLPVSISSPDGAVLPYWILLFPDPQPISDEDLAAAGVPFVPTPDFERMKGRRVFRLSNFSYFYVRENVREQLKRAGADYGIQWHRPLWESAGAD